MRQSTTSRLGAVLLSTVSAFSPPGGCSCAPSQELGGCEPGAYLSVQWWGVPLAPVRAEGACGGLRCDTAVPPPPGHSEDEGVWCGSPRGVVTGDTGDICRIVVGSGVLVIDTPIPDHPDDCRLVNLFITIDADAYRRAAGGSGGSGGSR